MRKEIIEDLEVDKKLPADHPERAKFHRLVDWLKTGGAVFPKLKICYYSENYRGVQALRDIKVKDTLLFVPKNLLITLSLCKASPIGVQITEKELHKKFKAELLPNFMAAFILTE